MPGEPWEPRIVAVPAREIPGDLLERFRHEPDIVEELSDRLRSQLHIESSIDLGGFAVSQDVTQIVGTVVTVRYVPKRISDNEQRLGHDAIAASLPAGAIVVVDARGCAGSVLGGVGAATLRNAGAAAALVEGVVRDLPEIAATGLGLVGRTAGIGSGRQTVALAEIGGAVTFGERAVTSGDVGLLNRSGLVCLPAWLGWDDVRGILADAS
jgi:regulator of RNase E activity RraA